MPAKPSLLIIEPDAFLAGIYARKFEVEGWKVSVAESLVEAEKMRAKRKFSAMIIEPDIDAKAVEQLIVALKADAATVAMPILVLSTISEKREIERMKKAGADAYLIKGHFVPTEAVKKVKALLISDKF